MVSCYSFWNLDYTARREVTGRGLEEEEWLRWKCVFEFLDMVRVVTAYCNNLTLFDILSEKGDNIVDWLTFLPLRTKDAAAAMVVCDYRYPPSPLCTLHQQQ